MLSRVFICTLFCVFASLQMSFARKRITIASSKDNSSAEVISLYDGLPNQGFAPIEIQLENPNSFSKTWSFSFSSKDSKYSSKRYKGNNVFSKFSFSCPSQESRTIRILVPLLSPTRHQTPNSAHFQLVVSINGENTDSIKGDSLNGWQHCLMSASLHHKNRSEIRKNLLLNNNKSGSTAFRSKSSKVKKLQAELAKKLRNSPEVKIQQELLKKVNTEPNEQKKTQLRVAFKDSKKRQTKDKSALESEYKIKIQKEVKKSRSTKSFLPQYFNGTIAFDPSDLMADWKSFSGFDTIILKDTEWISLRSEVRSSILEWNRLGGTLLVYTESTNQTLKDLNISPDSPNKSNTRSFGKVYLVPDLKGNIITDFTKFHSLITKSNAPQIQTSLKERKDTWIVFSLMKKMKEHKLSFFLLLITFSLMVGPLNILVFASDKRRHKIFITTPIIAGVFSCLMIFYILVSDGIGGTGTRITLQELRAENGEHATYTHQKQFCSTGLILRNSFKLNESILNSIPLKVSPWSRVHTSKNGSNNSYYNQTKPSGLFYSGDWFQSRSTLAHSIEAISPSRSKLILKENQQIASQLNYTLKEFYYLDQQEQWWKSPGTIHNGQVVQLVKIDTSKMNRILRALRKKLAQEDRAKLNRVKNRIGHFVAWTESPVPSIPTLKSIRWKTNRSIITGSIIKQ